MNKPDKFMKVEMHESDWFILVAIVNEHISRERNKYKQVDSEVLGRLVAAINWALTGTEKE